MPGTVPTSPARSESVILYAPCPVRAFFTSTTCAGPRSSWSLACTPQTLTVRSAAGITLIADRCPLRHCSFLPPGRCTCSPSSWGFCFFLPDTLLLLVFIGKVRGNSFETASSVLVFPSCSICSSSVQSQSISALIHGLPLNQPRSLTNR